MLWMLFLLEFIYLVIKGTYLLERRLSTFLLEILRGAAWCWQDFWTHISAFNGHLLDTDCMHGAGSQSKSRLWAKSNPGLSTSRVSHSGRTVWSVVASDTTGKTSEDNDTEESYRRPRAHAMNESYSCPAMPKWTGPPWNSLKWASFTLKLAQGNVEDPGQDSNICWMSTMCQVLGFYSQDQLLSS